MDKWGLCYETDVYRLVLFYILHVQNVIRFCVTISMQNYSDRFRTVKRNKHNEPLQERKPVCGILTDCTVTVPCYFSSSFRRVRCREKEAYWACRTVEKSPGLLPKMWPRRSWNIYIFPDNWTASTLEQHCRCNENVFKSHLYSCLVAIVSSSSPPMFSLCVL